MKDDLKSSTAIPDPDQPVEPKPTITLPTDLIPLPHIARELVQIVEPGQDIKGHRQIYHLIGLGLLPMIVFIRNRWYCPRPELPALAQALGLRLKQPGRSRAASRSRTTRSAA
jgi:hypothetical protein